MVLLSQPSRLDSPLTAVERVLTMPARGKPYSVLVPQAQNAQAAGAAAVLVYDDQINDYFVPASDGSIAGINIPAGAIPRRTGQLLVSAATVRTPPIP